MPSRAQTPRVRSTGQLSRNSSTAATTAITTATGRSVVRSGTWTVSGPHDFCSTSSNSVCSAKYSARLAITPTTAAVTPDSASATVRLCRNRST